jgi:glycine/D-amino acid oxidase-like deaminating enzyme
MRALAEALEESEVVQEVGTIRSVGTSAGDELRIETARGTYRAKRAVSCLVAPREGDRALCATTQKGEAFVLAILEREEDGVAITVEGDLELRAPTGRVRVAASEGIDVGTTGELNLTSRELRVNAREGSLFVETLAFVGGVANVDLERVKSAIGFLDQTLERLSQRMKRSYRFVEEVDITRAKQVDVRAEENVHVRGKNAMVTAEVLVKMDGQQIHLG